MQISHSEAQALFQYSLDRFLSEEERNVLDVHLGTCTECRSFINEVTSVETSLKSLGIQYISIQNNPLDINIFIKKANSKMIWFPQLATVSLLFFLFVMVVWQFSSSDITSAINTPHQFSPIPTPSPSKTSTFLMAQNCQKTIYITQTGDTLESIAIKFNTSQELIRNENGLFSNELDEGTEIMIPLCNVTPSLTINPPTFTTTFSPTALTAFTP